jgi:hypothetical protein
MEALNPLSFNLEMASMHHLFPDENANKRPVHSALPLNKMGNLAYD